MAIPVPDDLKARGSAAFAPPRRPGSVRRTATLDFTWPDGLAGNTVLDGRARDLRTTDDGTATGAPDAVGTPLYQLLDDIPGATLVSGAAWQRWYDMDVYLEIKADVSRRVMTDVCTGYQQGSSALQPDGTLRWRQDRQPAVDIDAVDDELAWHSHARPEGVTMRRARRIDVWADGPVLYVDAFFQDSSTLPEGGRQSIHEYTLTAQADLATGTVRAVAPVARVLPYDECPLAVGNVSALNGLPLSELRSAVLERLRGPLGCTHLNDMLRALADGPALARQLPAAPEI